MSEYELVTILVLMRIILIALIFITSSCANKSWRDASRESAQIATPAKEQKENIFQIYYARAFSWRGYFGIHPWFAWKKSEDSQYTVAQVTSWNIRRNGSSISIQNDIPDRKWYDNEPQIMFEMKGQKARKIIDKVKKQIQEYPYKDLYRVWPGPNSNTFVAYIINNVDELNLELPPHAVGKDFALTNQVIGLSPSKTGFQFSLYGILGLELGLLEGIEVNILGLNFGLDLYSPALKLPLAGRVGFKDTPWN